MLSAYEQLARRICPDRVADFYELEDHNRRFISSTSHFPSGDRIAIYLESIGDRFLLSDMGQLYTQFEYERMSLAGTRLDRAKSIASMHGIEHDETSFYTKASADNIADRYHAMCDGLLQISSMVLERHNRVASLLDSEIELNLRHNLTDRFRVFSKFKYEDLPQSNLYPIDWSVQTARLHPVCHIFGIRSETKAVEVVAAGHFFKMQNLNIPTLSVVDTPVKALSKRHSEQLHSLDGKVLYRNMPHYQQRMIEFISGLSSAA